MNRNRTFIFVMLVLVTFGANAEGEAQKRWKMMNQIRQEKFDLVLPEVMRENGIDMWITVNREGFDDPLTPDFGRGYGEENDFSMRASRAGFRNILCDDAYVVHHGAASFGATGLTPGEDSMRRLLSRHPEYMDIVSRFIEEDPLAKRRTAVTRALESAGIALG